MKNTLIIDNFLIIKHVEIDVKRYNVLIGPQASGKSIIAKLLYLFYHFPEFSFDVITDKGNKRELNKRMVDTFIKIFPEPIWRSKDFSISFETEVGTFSFSHQINKKIKFTSSIKYNNLFASLVKRYNHEIEEKSEESHKSWKSQNLGNAIRNLKRNIHEADWGFVNCGGSCLFIPAGRSFFATLKENVFSFLRDDFHFDYFIKEFGSEYEWIKHRFEIFKDKSNCEAIQNKLLKGHYIRKKEVDFIHSTDSKGESFDIEMSDASSGQQELLPIILTLNSGVNSFFIIEEPEAHIFPEAQYDLIRYIISKHNPENEEQAFLFTTHSPYILTAMNNLVYAGLLAKKLKDAGKEEALQKLEQIYSKKERIPADELSAYYVESGEAKNIVDTETGLICAEELDRISGMISERFDQMMDLESENEES